jgi:SAM-dependent methyltransferase
MDDRDYGELARERIRVFRVEAQELARGVPPPGRLLDVGCAEGYFLDAAAEVGWETYGVELSECAGSRALAKGHRVLFGEVSDAGWADGFFQVITLWDVLEHLDEPQTALRKLSELLAPDGLLLVMTPDLSSTVARALGERWWSVVDMHLHYFTPRTLTLLLRRCGLRPVGWGTYPKRVTAGYAGRWLTSWGAIGRAIRRCLSAAGLDELTITIDPRDQMKVYARKA